MVQSYLGHPFGNCLHSHWHQQPRNPPSQLQKDVEDLWHGRFRESRRGSGWRCRTVCETTCYVERRPNKSERLELREQRIVWSGWDVLPDTWQVHSFRTDNRRLFRIHCLGEKLRRSLVESQKHLGMRVGESVTAHVTHSLRLEFYLKGNGN